MIPRKIWTVWLSEEEEMPTLIQECIDSQKIMGYEHKVITLNCLGQEKNHPYLKQALDAKKWVKAVDFIRMSYLYTYGGIFLDADVEVLDDKNFDHLLGNQMFAAREKNGFIGAAVLGAVKEYEFINCWMDEVVTNFRGDDDKNFESSMDILVRGYFEKNWPIEGFKLVPTETFYPYDHQSGSVSILQNTITYHHFYKSWVPKPKISIVIPQLGREDGLQRLLDSILDLHYPKECIEVVVERGPETVPNKLKGALPKCTGEYICFMANDTEFTPEALIKAVECSQKEKKALVSFNTGTLLPDQGNICEHFIIRKDFVSLIGGEIFSTKLYHVGVDNLLWAKCLKKNQAIRCEEAIVKHKHFSKGYGWDDVYAKGWEKFEEDRKILAEELAKL